jgi:uncharacterized glyoxalase superfamily protein PhnB
MAAEIIPYIFYQDVPKALDWLARAFGFTEHMRVGTPSGGMHAEMLFEGRKIMMGQGAKDWRMMPPGPDGDATQGVFVYLKGVDAHFERAKAAGAEIVQEIADHGYGRTYTVRDLDGHPWYFTEAPG